MGANSIHSNLSKDDIIADIRLTLSADFEHEKIVIVVEGEDDIVFFNGKLHPDVDIHESFSGKQGVKEIVTFFLMIELLEFVTQIMINLANALNFCITIFLA